MRSLLWIAFLLLQSSRIYSFKLKTNSILRSNGLKYQSRSLSWERTGGEIEKMNANVQPMLNITTLRDYKKRRDLKSGSHPYYNLTIWNYLDTVQYNDKWDDITSICRGLVTDDTGRIIARSFPKFFNVGEGKHTHMDEYRVFDKVDGSLGILFYYDNKWIFASRGSFTSPQSTEGLKILNERFPQYRELDKSRSYIFEIIYPDNKIIVNYGTLRTVIYLTSFDPNGNEYLDLEMMRELGFDVVEEFPNTCKTLSEYQEMNLENKEGFVIRYASGERVKVKFENYVALHRYNTNITVKSIHAMMKDGKTLEVMLEGIPDEFNHRFRDIHNNLTDAYNSIYAECKTIADKHRDLTKGDYAELVKDHPYSTLLFNMIDNQSEEVIRNTIFNLIDVKSMESKLSGFTSKSKSKKKWRRR